MLQAIENVEFYSDVIHNGKPVQVWDTESKSNPDSVCLKRATGSYYRVPFGTLVEVVETATDRMNRVFAEAKATRRNPEPVRPAVFAIGIESGQIAFTSDDKWTTRAAYYAFKGCEFAFINAGSQTIKLVSGRVAERSARLSDEIVREAIYKMGIR